MAVTIRGSGQVPVQIVSVAKTDTFSTTSTSFVDITGLSLTITPTSASNKILIMLSVIGGSATINYAINTFRLMRDATPICVGNAAAGYTQATVGGIRSVHDTNGTFVFPINFLDSPATTSAVTYKLQGFIESQTMRINTNGSDASGASWSFRGASTITAMELSYA